MNHKTRIQKNLNKFLKSFSITNSRDCMGSSYQTQLLYQKIKIYSIDTMSFILACTFHIVGIIVFCGVNSASLQDIDKETVICCSKLGEFPASAELKCITMPSDDVSVFDEYCCNISSASGFDFNATEVFTQNNIKRSWCRTSFKYPTKMIFTPPPAGTLDNNYLDSSPIHHRFKRFPRKCNDTLAPLKNAVVTCWAWPNYLTCDVQCTHGHALREDGKVYVKTVRNCREAENYWSPKNTFPVCEPFLNCKTHLVRPGNMKCKSSMVTPSYCDISCLPDSEHDEVQEKRYVCDDRKYAASLPHCAGIDETIHLIEPPK